MPGLPANSQLAILGSGRLEQDLKAQARELGIGDRVLFLGQVPDARRYFRAFDVFALSSDHEPFGMVLLEAMAAGVPLLATACGGAKEVVEGVGILFPLGDAEHLAQGLQHLAAMDEQQRRQCAELMLERLRERFSDRAVRDAFWHLPHVIELAREGLMLNRFQGWRERGWSVVDASTYAEAWQRFGGSVATHPLVVERLAGWPTSRCVTWPGSRAANSRRRSRPGAATWPCPRTCSSATAKKACSTSAMPR